MIVFDGKDAVEFYTAVALKAGLKMWVRTGMKPNTAWTPTAMMRMGQRITGENLGRDYVEMIKALEYWIDEASKHMRRV